MFYIACSVINSTLNSNALTVFKLQSTGLLLFIIHSPVQAFESIAASIG